MRIKFWGVRGSIPTPERRNSRYGGNTTCLEVRLDNGTLLILDCGSGLRALGASLAREFGDLPLRCHIFLTHFHWDHIQGAPFFSPLYRAENEFLFYAVRRREADIKAAIEGQMINPYFPVDMTILHSARHFHDLDYAPIEIDGAVIRSAPLNHPQEAVAYRIEADGAAFVLATDTEPGSSFHDDALRKLAQGADVLVYDAQYRPEQLKQEKKGWGHSSWLEGSRIAKECGINHLFLFHHDPDHADTVVDGLVHSARREFPNTDGAAEGTELQLPEVELDADFLASISERRRETRYRIELPLRLCWKAIGGEAREARSMTVDISRSGIQFIVPDQLPTGQPVELEVTVPDEISQCGDLTMRFRAEPLRQERVERSFARAAGRGMAARLISPQVKSSYAA